MSKAYNYTGDYITVVCPNPSVDIYAWMDGVNAGESNRLLKEEHYAGGKGVHVALALAEMGMKVKLLGFWGGPTGEWIKEECQKYATIECVGPTVQGWSRSCYTFKSENDFDDTELLGVGPVIEQKDIEALHTIYNTLLPKSKGLVLSGSWPKGAPADAYQELIKSAKNENKITVLDCTGVQFENAVKEKPYLIHLNKSESILLFGGTDAKSASVRLAEYCEYAAVTDGAKGLYLTKENLTVHSSCAISNVYSSVGSGDCLTAGLSLGAVMGKSISEKGKMGVAFGAANCLRKELGYLYKSDVETLLEKAVSEELQVL